MPQFLPKIFIFPFSVKHHNSDMTEGRSRIECLRCVSGDLMKPFQGKVLYETSSHRALPCANGCSPFRARYCTKRLATGRCPVLMDVALSGQGIVRNV